MDKKKTRTLLFGILFLLILVGAYFAVSVFSEKDQKKAEQDKAQEEAETIILSVAPDQIQSISYQNGEEKVQFVQINGTWEIPGDSAFRMNETKCKLMTNDLAALKADRTIEDAEDLEQYGLGTEARIVTVEKTDGSTEEIQIGNRNPANNQLYFSLKEPGTVYLTETALDQHFSGNAKEFAVYEAFPQLQPADMRRFEVHKAENSYTLDMPGDASCTVTDENGNQQNADVNLVGTLQNNLSNITWIGNAEYDCKDFAEYGLDIPSAEIRITMEKHITGEEEIPDIGEAAGNSLRKTDPAENIVFISVGNQDNSGNYYVRLDDSREVHVVRREYLEPFISSDASSFWSRSYSFVSIGDLDHMDVTVQGETHTLRREASSDGAEIHWYLDEKEVEKDAFTDFYYACVSVTAQERLAEIPVLEEEPVLELHYYLQDGTEKVISYYKCDQNFYTAIYENGTKAAQTNKIYVNAMLDQYQKLLTNQ